jgi:hypothetical protein
VIDRDVWSAASAPSWPELAGVFIALLLSSPAHGTETSAVRTVLVLYAESHVLPGTAVVDDQLSARLRQSVGSIRFYTEFLDVSWFPDARIQASQLDLLRQKYAGKRLDLVVPAGPGALRFALLHRATIFPGVPIVFTAV